MVDPEKVRKEMKRFPQGANWKTLADRLGIKHTTIYEALNKLRESEEVCNQRGLWFLGARPPELKPPSEEKSADSAVIPLLNVPSSDMDPVIAATVAQQDANLSLVDLCIKHKLFKSDDPEFVKLVDLWRANRNQLVAVGMMWKVIARLNGYDSFIEYINGRANRDRQLEALKRLLESEKGSDCG